MNEMETKLKYLLYKHKLLLISLIILFANNIFAQNLTDTITANYIQESIKYSKLFIRNIEANNVEKAKLIIKKWESVCGETEPIYRAKIITSIKNKSVLDTTLIYKEFIKHVLQYKERFSKVNYTTNKSYYHYTLCVDYIPVDGDFDSYFDNSTIKFSKEHINNYNKNTTEYLFLNLYRSKGNDSTFIQIKNNIYNDNNIKKLYDNKIEEYKKIKEIYFSLLFGAWVPSGRLSVIGVLPQVGIIIGLEQNGFLYEFHYSLNGLSSKIPNTFYAKRNNKLEKTNIFYGGTMGINVGRRIYLKNNNKLNVLGGIAYEGAVVLLKDNVNNLLPQEANTYNINFGFNYKYYINNFFIGTEIKYNIVDYTMSDIIDLKGDVFTFRVTIGGSITSKYKKLNILRY